MWRSDGWGWRARIGLLVPHADICEEAELRAMAPEGVSIHATRVPFAAMGKGGTMGMVGSDALRAYLAPPVLDDAAELLAFAPLHVIAVCFTNTSFLGTVDDDQKLLGRLQQRTREIPVITTCLSAVSALAALGASRVALINPPWVDATTTKGGAHYFASAGLETVLAESAELPNNQWDVQPGTLYAWARAHVPPEAEAVFIGGNGFRAVGAIEALEADLGRPVLTANQVILWHALQLAGANVRISGYGRIFEVRLVR